MDKKHMDKNLQDLFDIGRDILCLISITKDSCTNNDYTDQEVILEIILEKQEELLIKLEILNQEVILSK